MQYPPPQCSNVQRSEGQTKNIHSAAAWLRHWADRHAASFPTFVFLPCVTATVWWPSEWCCQAAASRVIDGKLRVATKQVDNDHFKHSPTAPNPGEQIQLATAMNPMECLVSVGQKRGNKSGPKQIQAVQAIQRQYWRQVHLKHSLLRQGPSGPLQLISALRTLMVIMTMNLDGWPLHFWSAQICLSRFFHVEIETTPTHAHPMLMKSTYREVSNFSLHWIPQHWTLLIF